MFIQRLRVVAVGAILIAGIHTSVQTAYAQAPAAPGAALDQQLRPTYVLGPGDQITVRAPNADEIGDRPYRVEGDGYITLPIVGRIRAGGVSVEGLEKSLTEALKTYIRNPVVTINVVQFRSEPVFLVGAFKTPGIYPLQGRKTLVELLSSAGGLSPNAGRRIKVTRRTDIGKIELPTARMDADGQTSSVEISLVSLQDSINPREDIILQPYDVISAPRAEMIYVTGEVSKVGSIELGERDSMSLTQVLALSGGIARGADTKHIRVLRPIMDTSRRAEIPIDLEGVMTGHLNDFPLLPNDVLVVPRSAKRAFWTTMGLVGIPTAITAAVLFR